MTNDNQTTAELIEELKEDYTPDGYLSFHISKRLVIADRLHSQQTLIDGLEKSFEFIAEIVGNKIGDDTTNDEEAMYCQALRTLKLITEAKK